MPRNWYEWAVMRRNNQDDKTDRNNLNVSDQNSHEINEIKCDSVTKRNVNTSLSTLAENQIDRSSFASIDSGFCSNYEEDNFSTEIDKEILREKLKKFIENIKSKRKPIFHSSENNINEEINSKDKFEPYDDELIEEMYENDESEWNGKFDKDGEYHGSGVLTFSDGGWTSGVWCHGQR